jgi:hypothetical protein
VLIAREGLIDDDLEVPIDLVQPLHVSNGAQHGVVAARFALELAEDHHRARSVDWP